jgi:hypothetical protein
MSAFGGKADIDWKCRNVCFWHKADIRCGAMQCSLSGVKRTLVGRAPMSAFDPNRTLELCLRVPRNNPEIAIYVPDFGFGTHRVFADLLLFWQASKLA